MASWCKWDGALAARGHENGAWGSFFLFERITPSPPGRRTSTLNEYGALLGRGFDGGNMMEVHFCPREAVA